MSPEERLTATYAAFNERDIDEVLAQMAEDVDWPNAWEGGRVVGHDAVRSYWTRQWAEIDPEVQPQSFRRLPDGRQKASDLQVLPKRLMGLEPTTFCMASRASGTGVGDNVPANGEFLASARSPGVWDFTPIHGSLRTD
jgi:SnoaL-like domain